MSDIGKDLRTYLQTKSTVTDLIGTRMFPRMLPQGESLPAIIFSVIGSTTENKITGASGGVRVVIQLDCYAETHIQANDLAEQVRLVLHGYTGAAGDSTIGHALLDNKREMFDAPTDASDVPSYRVMMEWEILHNETIPSF